MNRTLGIFLYFSLFMALLSSGSAQMYYVQHITVEDGLPSSMVNSVVQDNYGYIWVATDNGLARYDGQTFETYDHQLPSRYVRHLDNLDSSILCTHDAGVSTIGCSPSHNSIYDYWHHTNPGSKPSGRYADCLLVSQSSDLWIGYQDGCVDKIEASDGSISTYRIGSKNRTLPIDGFIQQTSDGSLWVAESSGTLFLYQASQDSLTPVMEVDTISAITTQNNILWVATKKELLALVDNAHSGIQIRDRINIDGIVTAMTVDSLANMYIALDGEGLKFLHRGHYTSEWKEMYSNNDPHRVEQLPFRHIRHLKIIGDDLWVCAQEGLGIVQQRFLLCVNGLPNSGVNSVSQHGSSMLVNMGELYFLDPYQSGYGARPVDLRAEGSIGSVCSDSKANMWYGTSLGHLYCSEPSGRVSREIDLSYRGEGIFVINADSRDRVWVCQAPSDKPIRGVLCVLADGSLKEYGSDQGFERRILNIKESRQGRLHACGIGKKSYFFRYHEQSDAFVNLSIPFPFYVGQNFEVHDFDIDIEGVIWLATTDGLLRQEGDRISKIDLGPHMHDVEVRAVLSMPDGSLWLATDSQGLLYYGDNEVWRIGEESGLPSKIMSYRALAVDEENRLWAGTAEGLVYSRQALPSISATPKPYLRRIEVAAKEYLDGNIHINHDQEAHIFLSLPYYHGYRRFFRYRVDGMDWVEAGHEMPIVLSGWPEGQHSVEFSARLEGAYRWSPSVEIPFTQRTIWYNSRWFSLGWPLVLLTSAILFFMLKRKKYKKKIHDLERQVTQPSD